MIYVTHDQTEALTFADTVVVMHDGAVVQIGTPDELFERAGAHLRRLFHRLARHERAAGRGRGREARVDGHVDRAAPQLSTSSGRRARSSSASGPNSSTLAAPAPGLLRSTIERIDDLGRIALRPASRSATPSSRRRVPPDFASAGEHAPG